MPKGREKLTYFNENQKHAIVEDFCINYINHRVWIQNEPIRIMDWSPPDKPLTCTRLLIVGNQAYDLAGDYLSWVKEKKIKIERGIGESNRLIRNLESMGIVYSARVPESVEWLESILSTSSPVDDIPSKIDELVLKYSDAIKVPNEIKQQVENELYSDIITLMVKRRIIGDFKLQPLRDAELQNFREKLDNFENRVKGVDEQLSNIQRGGLTR